MAASRARYSIKSATSKTASFPTLIQWLSPMLCFWAKLRIEPAKAPLWEIKPTFPSISLSRSKTLLKLEITLSFKLMSPWQLGPHKAIFDVRAISATCACSRLPSAPASANPELNKTADFTFNRTHARRLSKTNLAGSAIIT